MGELEIAALLCSRVCHDLISPVGAIGNGLEVLEEDDDEEMREHAMALLKSSATQASVKLQFARLAFGAAGSAGSEIDLGDVERVARGYIELGKASLEWNAEPPTLVKDYVKLLLNLLLIANDTIPRGGVLKVSISGPSDKATVEISAQGEKAKLAPEVAELLASADIGERQLDARSIQPHLTKRVADSLGVNLTTVAEEDAVRFSAG